MCDIQLLLLLPLLPFIVFSHGDPNLAGQLENMVNAIRTFMRPHQGPLSVELSHGNPELAGQLEHMVNAITSFMGFKQGNSLSSELVAGGARVSGFVTKAQRQLRRELLKHVQDALGMAPQDNSAMSMALHRILTLLSFDMRNYSLFFDRTVYKRDPLAKLSPQQIANLHQVRVHAARPGRPARVAPAARKAVVAPRTRLGSADVRRLASFDKYGGIFWQYVLTSPPGALAASPTLLETIDRVVRSNLNAPRGNGRVLVLIDSPYEQSLLVLVALLTLVTLSHCPHLPTNG
ncbi:hypothetical protein QBC46DRAFT_433135 [Diplogelasinospora grovesii]|uniref:Uncharacterized protein n=1 Tax=Diplogelasinospora grovesii TaxID=303347 RepID=A0AAN6N801_9PEZI|nr:hypothetical protein QBC46DRAFT_433135 [Diplogelasinospora grovesii]